MSDGVDATKKDPSARLNPLTVLANALIVRGSPTSNPCALCVVTVIRLAPVPAVPTDASVTTLITAASDPGIS